MTGWQVGVNFPSPYGGLTQRSGLEYGSAALNAIGVLPFILALGERRVLAAPNELGLTTQGFDQMSGANLLRETTKAFKESGIPKAESILGEARSGYMEAPWGSEGAGTATEAALRPMLELPPSDVLRLDQNRAVSRGSRATRRRRLGLRQQVWHSFSAGHNDLTGHRASGGFRGC